MSHFTRLKTQMIEKDFVLKALEDLGYQYHIGKHTVRGFGGQASDVDIKIPLRLSYDIGLHWNGSSYDVVADWYGVRGVKRQEFVDRLAQRYAYHASMAKLQEQGFVLAEEEVKETGQIRLVMRRMV